MKLKIISVLLVVVMLFSTAMTVSFAEGSKDPNAYVELQGDWHFKLYRTYNQMFQYQPYGASNPTWEDNELAAVPNEEIFSQWETFRMPADDATTGGLLPQKREDDSNLFPVWSEAWLCRTFDLPGDFTTDEKVTLLMGVIDDADVIYINGTPVASSGFKGADGKPCLNDLELGGFQRGVIDFEKSYWEVAREYTIPTSLLNLGGSNEISIRVFNNNSLGGFYSDRIYAICGNKTAVNYIKGLPYEDVEDANVQKDFEALYSKQVAALASGDASAYAATIADNYNSDGADKSDRLAAAQAMMGEVTDTDAGLYYVADGSYSYMAHRVITKDGVVVFEGDISISYAYIDGKLLERGNWNRCYTTSYYSELFGQNLGYSVWLPPSYFADTTRTYPIVYLLHGQNSSSVSYLNVDNIGGFMDNLTAEGKVIEMIVVMPDSGKNAFYRDSELTSDINNSGPWATQLSEELRLVVEANYRTMNAPEFRALTGNSMGGGGTYSVGAAHPELYSSLASHMGYLPDANLAAMKALTPEQLEKYDFYLDCGLQDTTVGTKGTENAHAYLESMGKEHYFELRDGIHGSAFYMGSMDKSMIFHSEHFKKNMTPAPKPVQPAAPVEVEEEKYITVVNGITGMTADEQKDTLNMVEWLRKNGYAAYCFDIDGNTSGDVTVAVPTPSGCAVNAYKLHDGKWEEVTVVSFGGGNVTLHMDGRFCPVVVGVKAVKGVVSPKTGLW